MTPTKVRSECRWCLPSRGGVARWRREVAFARWRREVASRGGVRGWRRGVASRGVGHGPCTHLYAYTPARLRAYTPTRLRACTPTRSLYLVPTKDEEHAECFVDHIPQRNDQDEGYYEDEERREAEAEGPVRPNHHLDDLVGGGWWWWCVMERVTSVEKFYLTETGPQPNPTLTQTQT